MLGAGEGQNPEQNLCSNPDAHAFSIQCMLHLHDLTYLLKLNNTSLQAFLHSVRHYGMGKNLHTKR